MTNPDDLKRGRHYSGPNTARGKFHSSRNAFRHGLAASNFKDLKTQHRIDEVARAILGNVRDRRQLRLARPVAEALIEIERIRNYVDPFESWINQRCAASDTVNEKSATLISPSSRYLSRAYGRLRACVRRLDQTFYGADAWF